MDASNKYGLKFHHLGLAVREPQGAVHMLKGLGYEIGPTVRDPAQNVHLALCTRDGAPAVEIIYETETSGPLAGVLKSNPVLIYHMCYESENLEKSLAAMQNDKTVVKMVSPPTPAPLFGGRKVSFYRVRGFGLIEILENA